MLSLSQTSEAAGLKEISSVLDERPLLTGELARLAFFMKERCYCTLYDAAKAMLPAGIGYRVTTLYSVAGGIDESLLDEEEARLVDCIKNNGGSMKKEPLFEAMGYASDNPLPDSMARRGLLDKSDDAAGKSGTRPSKCSGCARRRLRL